MNIEAPTLADALSTIVGEPHVRPPSALYLSDETETRGVHGRADLVVSPGSAEEVRNVVAYCYESGVPIVPRGGGTGFAGGAVPVAGGIVLSLERLDRVRQFDPLLWRIQVEAGTRTSELRRIVRESGLLFPPDPGAAESSQIGGNIATNAGGPHAFKYGVTGDWVLGLEAVVPPGEIIRVGGPIRKDVAGYDLKSLLIGSEGTLGIITAAWLKLIPAPEAGFPLLALYPDVVSGVAAIEAVLGNGLAVAALEYLDGRSMAASAGGLPLALPADTAFAVLVDVDGSPAEADALAAATGEVLAEGALGLHAPTERVAIEQLWRWRDSVSIGVTAQRGGKVSEDIVVPVDRLAEALSGAAGIAARHGLESCSWGHAGDGNLHATFLIDPSDDAELARAADAAKELFALALGLGGSVSGEHGVGVVKRGQLSHQWTSRAVSLHEAVKDAFDPKNLLNPGKKLAR
jgi:glycolate dehydrogenase FAD-linked subunit